jgi:17beta-estradiol 17-dehydrogenase / very-long-chain 3-oxoacyl-CoA reductase
MNHFANLFSEHYISTVSAAPAGILMTLMILGGLKVTSWALSTLSFVYRHTIKWRPNLQAKYGSKSQKSWAVVTGGSDGIGEQFCKDLAREGFNICMVGRNARKMIEKLEKIKSECGKDIDTKYVVADFGEMTRYADYERVSEELKSIDVAILVLNAGWTIMGNFVDLEPKEIEDTINTEALQPVYLCKAMLP